MLCPFISFIQVTSASPQTGGTLSPPTVATNGTNTAHVVEIDVDGVGTANTTAAADGGTDTPGSLEASATATESRQDGESDMSKLNAAPAVEESESFASPARSPMAHFSRSVTPLDQPEVASPIYDDAHNIHHSTEASPASLTSPPRHTDKLWNESGAVDPPRTADASPLANPFPQEASASTEVTGSAASTSDESRASMAGRAPATEEAATRTSVSSAAGVDRKMSSISQPPTDAVAARTSVSRSASVDRKMSSTSQTPTGAVGAVAARTSVSSSGGDRKMSSTSQPPADPRASVSSGVAIVSPEAVSASNQPEGQGDEVADTVVNADNAPRASVHVESKTTESPVPSEESPLPALPRDATPLPTPPLDDGGEVGSDSGIAPSGGTRNSVIQVQPDVADGGTNGPAQSGASGRDQPADAVAARMSVASVTSGRKMSAAGQVPTSTSLARSSVSSTGAARKSSAVGQVATETLVATGASVSTSSGDSKMLPPAQPSARSSVTSAAVDRRTSAAGSASTASATQADVTVAGSGDDSGAQTTVLDGNDASAPSLTAISEEGGDEGTVVCD